MSGTVVPLVRRLPLGRAPPGLGCGDLAPGNRARCGDLEPGNRARCGDPGGERSGGDSIKKSLEAVRRKFR